MDDGGEEPERAEMSAPNTWMECSIYQNYTASEVMVQGLAGVVSQVSPNAQSQRSIPMLSPTDLSQCSVPQIFPNAQSDRSFPMLSPTDLSQCSVPQIFPNAQSQRSIPMLSPTDLSQSPVPQSDSSRL